MAGCLLAAATYFPLFKALTTAGNPQLAAALHSAPVTLHADPDECSFQFNPTGTLKFTNSCDVTKAQLQEQLTDMTTRATKAEDRIGQLTKENETLTSERDSAPQLASEHGKRVDLLEQEKRELGNQLRAYKGSATKARDQVTILKAELSPETRPIGAPKPPKTDEQQTARAEALEAAFAMGPTTIVFSDGRREIREIAPLVVDGNAWLQTARGRELDHDTILSRHYHVPLLLSPYGYSTYRGS